MRLRARALWLFAVVGASVVAASSAQADTLFTSPARTTPVAVGTTATVRASTVTAAGTLGGVDFSNDCTSSTLTLSIVQNTAAVIAADVTGGSFSGCGTSVTGRFPWRVTVRGSGVASGSDTVFTTSTWDHVSLTAQGVTATSDLPDAPGPFADGVYARQTTASGTGICLEWSNTPISWPTLTDARASATYCLEGAPANAWSIGLPAASFLRADPAGTAVASGATISNRSGVATLTLPAGSATCTGSAWGFTAGASGGAVVTGALDSATLTSCTDTLPGVAVTSCARFSTGATSAVFQETGPSGGSVTTSSISLRCALAGTTTGCYYNVPSPTGTWINAPSSLAIGGAANHQVPVGVTDDTGSALCESSGAFVANLFDLTTGAATTTVTLKQS